MTSIRSGTRQLLSGLLCAAILATQSISPAACANAYVLENPCRPSNRNLFIAQAINPELVVAPSVPLLHAGVHLRSEINFDVSHDEVLTQLHGRAAVSLVREGNNTGLQTLQTEGQKIYGKAHYNDKSAIEYLFNALRDGVEMAIRR